MVYELENIDRVKRLIKWNKKSKLKGYGLMFKIIFYVDYRWKWVWWFYYLLYVYIIKLFYY